MVRRRIPEGGLTNPLTFSACQHLLPTAFMSQASPYAPNQQLQHWQAQQQLLQQQQQRMLAPRQTLVSSMSRLAGGMPRIPTLTQRELNQHMWQQQQQQLINMPHTSMLPGYAPDTQLNPLTLPMWCHSCEDIFTNNNSNLPQQQHRQRASDISLELKQQMQQLRRHQQLLVLQEKQRQQQRQRQRQQNPFEPFNFGKCANSLINFYDKRSSDTESVLYSATHPLVMRRVTAPAAARKPPQVPAKPVQGCCKDLNYVNLPRQNLTAAQPPKEKLTKQQRQLVERTQVIPLPVIQTLPRKDKSSTDTSTTTLTDKPRAQPRQKTKNKSTQLKPTLAKLLATQQELEVLALDIDKNLTAVRQLLTAEPPQKLNARPVQRQSQTTQVETQTLAQPATNPCLIAKTNSELDSKELILSPEELELLAKILEEESVHRVLNEGTSETSSIPIPNESTSETGSIPVPPPPPSTPIKAVDSGELGATADPKAKLNLSKLFEHNKLQDVEASPMWNSLMQLVARMCDNPKVKSESADLARMKAGSGNEQAQKQYSIYLMVSSDDEDEPAASKGKAAEQSIPSYIPMNYENICDVKYQQENCKPARKKKRVGFKRYNIESAICPLLPPRRPLHWPKLDHSMPQKKRKKLLRRTASKTSNRMHKRRSAIQDAIECSKWWQRHQQTQNRPQRSPHYMPTPLLANRTLPTIPLQNSFRFH